MPETQNIEEFLELPQIKKSQIGLNEVLSIQKDSIMESLNCHNIGRIVKFYPETQTADIQIMILKQIQGETIIPSILNNVPLIIYGAGGGHITLPDPIGTICLLFFMDRNMDSFILTNEMYAPRNPRMHDFTDCIALTTFKTLANPLTEYDEKAITIMNEEIVEEIKKTGFIKVYGGSVLIKTNIEGEEPAGAQIEVSDKINIQNTVQSLAALIQAFITACENITTVADESGGGLSPESKQLFTDLKAKFEELLI